MIVLISGAHGFVGTNLSKYLAGHGVTCWALDVKNPKGTVYARQFTWEQLGEIPWREVDAVVHLAGKAHDTKHTADPKSYFDINVGLTEKIVMSYELAVMSCREGPGKGEKLLVNSYQLSVKKDQLPVKELGEGKLITHNSRTHNLKFVFFSSVKACADTVEGVLTEEAVPQPKTPYGQSKLKAEEILARHAKDADIYVLRPAMIHGPGNKGNLNLLYSVVKKGLPWPLGAFENRRSFTSIENICAVVQALCEGKAKPGTYQMADDEALSTNELIGLIDGALGKKARIWKVPVGLVRFCAKVGDVLHLPLNSERLKKLTESYVVSNAKIKKALGWGKMPIRAEAGIQTTLRSFGKL